ncbi:hypothetical protein AB1L42_22740 [Thalassoglobus sp. JC818]|uniref:hypothetical protein n=1 Tax=Thalassoglobus sp. JC818 TaxID=3232136 RepID=UPI00345B4755
MQDFNTQFSGISFLDRAIPVGHKRNGVHAILGATGTGITTLASMIAAEGGKQHLKSSSQKSEGRWAYVASQSSLKELKTRLTCCLADLPFSAASEGRLDAVDGCGDVRQRLETATYMVDNGFCLVDANSLPVASWGSPAHVAVDHILQQIGCGTLVGLTIDDVPSLIQGRIGAKHATTRDSISMTTSLLRECRDFAEALGCPIWIGHQLWGGVATNKPRADLTHKDAMDYYELDKWIDTAFVLGNHAQNGMFQIRCTEPFADDETSLAVVRFRPGGTFIQEVDCEERTAFLTDSWKRPSFDMPEDVRQLVIDRHAELRKSSRDEELRTRMVRAAGIE